MLWNCYKYSSILICFDILQGFIGFVLLFSFVNWPFWLVFFKCRVCSHNVRSPWGSVNFPSSGYLCEKGGGHHCKARRERRTSSKGMNGKSRNDKKHCVVGTHTLHFLYGHHDVAPKYETTKLMAWHYFWHCWEMHLNLHLTTKKLNSI